MAGICARRGVLSGTSPVGEALERGERPGNTRNGHAPCTSTRAHGEITARLTPSTPPIVNVRHLLSAAAVIATFAAAPMARAQSSDTQHHFGPTVTAASAAVRPDLRMDASVPRALDLRQQLRRSETLMIVGGAIFLAGAIIGDDAGTIIMIGGAGIGIYGLYLYLQ